MSIKGLLYFDMKFFEMSIKGLLYSNLELLKFWSKVFSTSIWNCWNGNQKSSLLQSGLLKCWSNVFSTLIWIVEMSIKGLLYFNLELLSVKSQNLGLDFKCWVHCCSIAFGMGDFYLFLLDFELYQESFNWQKILFLRNIWFLKLGNFKIDI